MPYEIKVSHIREDFTISDENSEVWRRTLGENNELSTLLNRIAIATTNFPVFDFPEVEIQLDSRRVYVRAISGKLYYTEHGSSNRKDLVVVPDEIIRLLGGQTVEQALHHDPDEDAYVRPDSESRGAQKEFRYILLAVTLLVLAGSIYYSWKNVTHQPRLVEPPRFVYMMEKQGELLRKYADVYVSELREGAMLFELSKDGNFSSYEMWFSKTRNRFVLVPVESHIVSAGLYQGVDALLAGEVDLLELKEDAIVLHGQHFRRLGKKLSSVGEVLSGEF